MNHEHDPPPASLEAEDLIPPDEGASEQASQEAPLSSSQEKSAANSIEEVDFREKYLRELAEKENMRKRLLREQQEAIRLAGEKSAIDLLAPIDQFEKALEFARSMSEEVKNWAVGFEMICEQIRSWLAGQGIHPFKSEGEMFTPLLHEAIERIVDNDRPSGLVLREFTKGYRGRTRVLRPARVAVCVHAQPPTETPNTPNETGSNRGDDHLESSTAPSEHHHEE